MQQLKGGRGDKGEKGDKGDRGEKGDIYFWGNIEGGACRSELVALVGPFTTGSRDRFDEANGTEGDQPGSICGEDGLMGSMMSLEKLVENIKKRLDEQREKPSEIRLIGRADSQPINNDEFRSNSGLAQARANWVWTQLSDQNKLSWPDDLQIVRAFAGPFVPGKFHDACDRSVEVHICWQPK